MAGGTSKRGEQRCGEERRPALQGGETVVEAERRGGRWHMEERCVVRVGRERQPAARGGEPIGSIGRGGRQCGEDKRTAGVCLYLLYMFANWL